MGRLEPLNYLRESVMKFGSMQNPVCSVILIVVYLLSPRLGLSQDKPAGKKSSLAKPQMRLLWPDGAPGAKGDKDFDQPRMFVYRPAKPNGTAVVVCPGGGYGGLAKDHEGAQIARYFNKHGVTAFVLHYRLGSKGYHHPIPLGDAQRALRIVRNEAKQEKLDPAKIGIMGFSAGGHLASTAGTHFDSGKSDATDPVDRVSSRPDFLILCYPVISMTTEFTHKGSRRNLLGAKHEDEKAQKVVSSELRVTAKTPPTFLFHTNEDRAVPSENSVLFYLALRRAGVPAEMHIYQKGRHGVGLLPGDPVISTWAKRLSDWMQVNGGLTRAERTSIKGKVSYDGKPVPWGMLTFIPRNSGPSVTTRIVQGEFKLDAKDGPTPGQHQVKVMLSPPGVRQPLVFAVNSVTSIGNVDVKRAANEFQFQLDSSR